MKNYNQPSQFRTLAASLRLRKRAQKSGHQPRRFYTSEELFLILGGPTKSVAAGPTAMPSWLEPKDAPAAE